VERKRDPETLLAGHPAVSGDLLVERGARIHRVILQPAIAKDGGLPEDPSQASTSRITSQI
jgi:hypothetical protein